MSSVLKPISRAELRATTPILVAQPTKPTGATRRAILNVLETFFRNPVLHLLPLILLSGLGLYTGLQTDDEYRSVGMLNATSGTLLNDLTQSGAGTFGFESPATTTSRNINERMGTEQFLDEVIDRARLRSAVESGQITRDELRSSVSASARGNNLIAVTATTPRPEQSQLLSQAVSDTFVEYVVQNDLGDQQVRVNFHETQLEEYERRLDDASDEYESYIEENEIAEEDDRPFVEQLAIERLEQNLERATDSFLDAQARLDEANLAADAARAVVARQLRVIDPPEVPTAALSTRRDAAITFVTFTALGTILAFAFVVARALLDRTVRVPDDITARVGLDVLAVVPQGRR